MILYIHVPVVYFNDMQYFILLYFDTQCRGLRVSKPSASGVSEHFNLEDLEKGSMLIEQLKRKD